MLRSSLVCCDERDTSSQGGVVARPPAAEVAAHHRESAKDGAMLTSPKGSARLAMWSTTECSAGIWFMMVSGTVMLAFSDGSVPNSDRLAGLIFSW